MRWGKHSFSGYYESPILCVWADMRAVSQPTPSVCLCANAVLKWAHYHQREHKHSSRKQDSLCQERAPLPQAQCRPDEITRLKIRQGVLLLLQACTPEQPLLSRRRQSTQLLEHSLSSFFSWLQLVLPPSSNNCLLQAAGRLRCIAVFLHLWLPYRKPLCHSNSPFWVHGVCVPRL